MIDKAKNAQGLRLTYVIGTYPLLTTTFIDREDSFATPMGGQFTDRFNPPTKAWIGSRAT